MNGGFQIGVKLWRADGVDEAVVERVDEHNPSVGKLADVVGVEFAGDEDRARHEASVEHMVDLLIGPEHVLELRLRWNSVASRMVSWSGTAIPIALRKKRSSTNSPPFTFCPSR